MYTELGGMKTSEELKAVLLNILLFLDVLFKVVMVIQASQKDSSPKICAANTMEIFFFWSLC